MSAVLSCECCWPPTAVLTNACFLREREREREGEGKRRKSAPHSHLFSSFSSQSVSWPFAATVPKCCPPLLHDRWHWHPSAAKVSCSLSQITTWKKLHNLGMFVWIIDDEWRSSAKFRVPFLFFVSFSLEHQLGDLTILYIRSFFLTCCGFSN